MKTPLKTLLVIIFAVTILTCSCTRKTTGTAAREYYSGVFTVEESGRASFTDCATRINLTVANEAGYELLREEYSGVEAEEVTLELYGSILRQESAPDGETSTLSPYGNLELRIDSLISVTPGSLCPGDHIVAGLYRRDWDGQPEILRLKPDYTYTLGTFNQGEEDAGRKGVWYLTSELTLELLPEVGGTPAKFQIVPARESITAIGGGEATVYVKEWL